MIWLAGPLCKVAMAAIVSLIKLEVSGYWMILLLGKCGYDFSLRMKLIECAVIGNTLLVSNTQIQMGTIISIS